MAAILGYLTLFKDLFYAIRDLVAMFKQANKEGWIQDGRELANAIKNVQTDDQRRELVKRLADHARAQS